jgi:hypothetical protein
VASDGGARSAAPAPLLPWIGTAAAVFGLPSWALAAGIQGPELLRVAGVTLAVHLGAFVAARRPLPLAIVLPPLAWALLLAERAAGAARRRAWAAATFLPGLVALAAAIYLATPAGETVAGGQVGPLGTAAAGLAAALLAAGAARATGALGALLRLAALPLWAGGGAALLALSLVAAPFALAARRAAPLARFAGTVLAGVLETFRGPRPPG